MLEVGGEKNTTLNIWSVKGITVAGNFDRNSGETCILYISNHFANENGKSLFTYVTLLHWLLSF